MRAITNCIPPQGVKNRPDTPCLIDMDLLLVFAARRVYISHTASVGSKC